MNHSSPTFLLFFLSLFCHHPISVVDHTVTKWDDLPAVMPSAKNVMSAMHVAGTPTKIRFFQRNKGST